MPVDKLFFFTRVLSPEQIKSLLYTIKTQFIKMYYLSNNLKTFKACHTQGCVVHLSMTPNSGQSFMVPITLYVLTSLQSLNLNTKKQQ